MLLVFVYLETQTSSLQGAQKFQWSCRRRSQIKSESPESQLRPLSSGQGCSVIELLFRTFAELAQGRRYLGNEKRKESKWSLGARWKPPFIQCLQGHPKARSLIMCSVLKNGLRFQVMSPKSKGRQDFLTSNHLLTSYVKTSAHSSIAQWSFINAKFHSSVHQLRRRKKKPISLVAFLILSSKTQ